MEKDHGILEIELRNLSSLLEELDKTIVEMQEKLSPISVSRPFKTDPSVAEVKPEPVPEHSTVVNRIIALSDNVTRLTRSLQHMNQSLEI